MDLFALKLDDFRPLDSLEAWRQAGPGLYALWDKEGSLLYIGQSGSIIGRQGAHRKRKWGKDIEKVTCFPGLRSASDRLIAEAVLILRHFPRHNRAVKLGLSAQKRTVCEIQFIRGKSNTQPEK